MTHQRINALKIKIRINYDIIVKIVESEEAKKVEMRKIEKIPSSVLFYIIFEYC